MNILYKYGFWTTLLLFAVFYVYSSGQKDVLTSIFTNTDETPDSTFIESTGTILLKNVERVAKLTVVENNYSEVFTFTDFTNWDLPIFRKKMVVKNDSRVGIGFDLKKMEFGIDEELKEIHINNIPLPEILYMEDNITYFDTEEGLFNSFSEKDYTEIHKKTKDMVMAMVCDSPVFQEVEYSFIDHLSILAQVAKESEWKILIKDNQWADEILYQL